MFWTIVGALTFFFFGIPIIILLITNKKFWKSIGFILLILILLLVIYFLKYGSESTQEILTAIAMIPLSIFLIFEIKNYLKNLKSKKQENKNQVFN